MTKAQKVESELSNFTLNLTIHLPMMKASKAGSGAKNFTPN